MDVDECESKKVQCSNGEVCVNQYGPDSCQGECSISCTFDETMTSFQEVSCCKGFGFEKGPNNFIFFHPVQNTFLDCKNLTFQKIKIFQI